MNIRLCGLSAAVVTCGLVGNAHASFHFWQIQEIFSNAAGTVQFIELHENTDFENFISATALRSLTTGKVFDFTTDLDTTETAGHHILLATPAFAALPGAPAPDYLIEPNFFSTSGDTLSLDFVATPSFTFLAGELPINGTLSLTFGAPHTSSTNTPTNFAGDTATISVGTVPEPQSLFILALATAGTLLAKHTRRLAPAHAR